MRKIYALVGVTLLVLTGSVSPRPTVELEAHQEQFVAKVPQEYPTIQSAIDAVQEGGIVLIGPGVYREDLYVTKSLRLIGAGRDLVKIVGAEGAKPAIIVESGRPIQIYFSSFTIGPKNGRGVEVKGAVQMLLEQLNIADLGTAIAIMEFQLLEPVPLPQVTLSRVLLSRNLAGLSVVGRVNVIVQDSVFQENEIGLEALLIGSGDIRAYRSVFSNNQRAALVLAGTFFTYGAGVELVENEIIGNGGGVYMGFSTEVGLVDISRNRILKNTAYGVAIVHPLCPELKEIFYLLIVQESAPVKLIGNENQITDNTKGDLCPADYPWPAGFRK